MFAALGWRVHACWLVKLEGWLVIICCKFCAALVHVYGFGCLGKARWMQAVTHCTHAASAAWQALPRATDWLQRFTPAIKLRPAAAGASRVNILVALQAESGWLAKVTGAWQAAKISNLDYLLYCNLAAGRSFNDLTQVSGRGAEAPSHQLQVIEVVCCHCQPPVRGRRSTSARMFEVLRQLAGTVPL